MNSYEDHRQVHGGIRSVRGLRRVGVASAILATFIACALVARPSRGQSVVVASKADLDQVRNGTAASPNNPGVWVNGNAGASNSHYVEGYSIPYRVVMTDLPLTAVTIELGYDIKHSGKHAIDYMTQYERLNDPLHTITFSPSHGPEDIDPTDGVAGEMEPPDATYAIPPPSSAGSPVFGQPTTDFGPPSSAREMSIWNATFTGSTGAPVSNDCTVLLGGGCVKYVSQGDLMATGSAETRFRVTFTPTSSTVILAWGGHIATGTVWGAGNSAGGISGSPYHTRLEAWSIGSLGNQDRSLSADAVECFCCNTNCNDCNDCTTDSCNEATNTCVHTNVTGGTACMPQTGPVSGVCTSTQDTFACTNEACNGSGACITTPNDAKCNDSNECTFNDCNPGAVGAGPDGCVYPPVAENTPCTADSVPCTDDRCQAGVCTHKPDDTACDDMATCTGDKCLPGPGADADGCVFNPNHAACDDLIGCTNDSCDPGHPAANAVTGCVNQANDGKCPDDSLYCNGTEFCDAIADCVHTGDPCFGTPTPVCCEVTDTCVAQCCSNADCPDDGTFCNGSEVCVAGVCGHTGNPCGPDNCSCTTDFCEEANDKCMHVPNNASCNDNIFCNGLDYCAPGDPTADPLTCCKDPGDPCPPPLQCNEIKDLCAGCLSDDKCPDNTFCDGIETCDETTQICTTEGPNPCPEDAITCTHINCNEVTDVCVSKLDDTACNDGITCTTDACDPTNPAANPVTGCVHTPINSVCNDMNVCTNDSCVPASCTPPCSGCVNAPKSAGFACGNQTAKGVCDNPDICNGMGQCVQNAKPAGTVCRPAAGDCDVTEFCDGVGKDCPQNQCEGVGTACPDDGNECTNDACDGFCHCTHPPKPDQTACSSDGNVCTKDVCKGGMCLHLPEPVTMACGNPTAKGVCDNPDHCDGMGGCVEDLKPPGTICRLAVNECDLTEVCTGTSPACPLDGCKPAGSLCPDDGDICTDDKCDGFCGCTHPPNELCETPDITCPPNKVFECDAVGGFGDPTVVDNCSVTLLVACTEESTPGKLPQERTIIRTCTVTNDCGNSAMCRQRIDIVDITPPVVTCPPDCTLECGDVQCVPPECDDPSCECGGVATCVDNCSTCTVSVTCEIVPKDCTAGQVAGLTPPPKLTVVRTFSATDASAAVTATGQGNIGRCVQHIEIVDSNPPLLIGCPDTITICRKADLPFTPPTCTDTCGTCSVTCVRSDNQPLPGPPPSEPITITCTASDECNESSCTIDVELSDSGECFVKIPTVSEWGLVVLTLLLLTGAKVFFGRRQVAAA